MTPPPDAGPAARARRRPFVAPLARALEVLAAFTPQDRLLGPRDLAARTGLPPSTVSRLVRSLVALGYLHHDTSAAGKVRLAPAVLALGYGAAAGSDVQETARVPMQAFAQAHQIHVALHARDRLDMVLLAACRGDGIPPLPDLKAGARLGVASIPIGGALLAGLPETERYYLFAKIERRRVQREWQPLRRRLGESISQVYESGFCSAQAGWDEQLNIVSVPLLAVGQAPLVLSGIGPGTRLSRIRVERELGPRLVALAHQIRHSVLTP